MVAKLLIVAVFAGLELCAWNWFRPKSAPWKVCTAILLAAVLAEICYELRLWNTLDPAAVPIRVEIPFLRSFALFCGLAALFRGAAAWAPHLRDFRRPRFVQFLATFVAFVIYVIYGNTWGLHGFFLPGAAMIYLLFDDLCVPFTIGQWNFCCLFVFLGAAAGVAVLRSGGMQRRWRFALAAPGLSLALLLTGMLLVNILTPGCLAGTIHGYEYPHGLVFNSFNRDERIKELSVSEKFFSTSGAVLTITAAPGKVVKLPGDTPETLRETFEKSEYEEAYHLDSGVPGEGDFWSIRVQCDGGKTTEVRLVWNGTPPPVTLTFDGKTRQLPLSVDEMRTIFGVPGTVTEVPFI